MPAPSTIVVLSLSTVIFLARPRCSSVEVLELDAEVFADQRAAGQHGDVAQHGLAAIAEAGGLHGTHIEHAAELVDDQRRQRLAFDVFGDDQQRLARLADLLQQRHQLAQIADLLFVDQDVARLRARSPSSAGWLMKYGEM